MKKTLKKKIKNSSNAVRYFSSETATKITTSIGKHDAYGNTIRWEPCGCDC